MTSITTDELLDYTICSYRFCFNSGKKPEKDYFAIRSEIYSKLFDYCLYLRLNKSSVTLGRLNQRLNFIWSELDNKDVINVNQKLTIKSKLNYILNTFKDINNIHYFELPRVVNLDGVDILYNVHTYSQSYSIRSVIKFNKLQFNNASSNSNLRFLATLVKKDLKNLDNYNHNIYLYRCDTADLYKPQLLSMNEYKNYCLSLEKVIKYKIHIPVNNHLNCKQCIHNTECKFYNE